MHVSAIDIYEILKKTFDEKDAKTIVVYLEDIREAKLARQVENKIEHLATSKQLSELKADIIKWMFIFIVGQTTILVALAIGILKFSH